MAAFRKLNNLAADFQACGSWQLMIKQNQIRLDFASHLDDLLAAPLFARISGKSELDSSPELLHGLDGLQFAQGKAAGKLNFPGPGGNLWYALPGTSRNALTRRGVEKEYGTVELCQNSLHNPSFKDTREFFFESVVHYKKVLMAQAEQMQNRGMPVRDADSVFDGMQTNFIRRTIGCSGLDAGTGHPCAECVFVVVSAGIAFIFIRRQLGDRKSAKLSSPDNQCGIEEPALFQILQQTGDRFVGTITASFEIGGQARMVIPRVSVDVQLNEAHATFHQSTSDQTAATVRVRWLRPDAIQFLRVLSL